MAAISSILKTLFIITLVGLSACDNNPNTGNANVEANVDPQGTNSTYIVDTLTLPTSASESTLLGLNLDGDEQGRIDNALGQIMAALANASGEGFGVNAVLSEAIDNSSKLLLMRLKATSLVDATGVGMWVYLGEENGSTAVSENSPTDSLTVGTIQNGTLTSGPGSISLEIEIIPDVTINLDLIGARVSANVSENNITSGVLAGAISETQLDNDVLPAVHSAVETTIEEDCAGTAPNCCNDNSGGATIVGLFDADQDCSVSLNEIRESNIISSLLNPDIDLLDANGNFNPNSDGVKESLSLGVGFTATQRDFTIP